MTMTEFRGFRLSPDDGSAFYGDRELHLTPTEFSLLEMFVSHPGIVLRRARIGAEIWGGEAPGRTIDIHVARLRSKLPEGSITTVIRVGYRFTPEAAAPH